MKETFYALYDAMMKESACGDYATASAYNYKLLNNN